MIVACVGLLIFFQLLNYVVSNPIKFEVFTNKTLSQSTIDQEYQNVMKLVNSVENKKVFNQLTNADYDFYDSNTNTVGTAQIHQNHYQTQPYVSNGYFGSRIPNLGQGFSYDDPSPGSSDQSTNGWPLFNERYAGAFIAGFYDIQNSTNGTNFPELQKNGYESVISAVPQWTTLQVSVNLNGTEYTLDPNENYGDITNYVQKMSLSNGIVETEFTWLNTFRIKYSVLAHREQINLGVITLDIYNLNQTLNVTVKDILDFSTSQRCQLVDTGNDDHGIYIRFQPHQIDYVTGSIYSILHTDLKVDTVKTSTANTSSQQIVFQLQSNSHASFTKYVGIVSTDLIDTDPLNFARDTALGFDSDTQTIIKSHIDAWDKTLESTPSVTFPDDLLLTLTSRASIFHLAANTRPQAQGVTAALGVGGLSSDSYAGLVFWDADLWMLNGLLPFVPSHAKSIVNYRLHTHEQAKKNLPPDYDGAVYSWTSGRFGNCTGTGPCMDYEYHINMAVAFAAWQVYISGNGDDIYLEEVSPLIMDAANFMGSYVKLNDTLKQYTTSNLTDPDEYANHVDNGAYTNAATSLLMKYAVAVGNHLNQQVPSKISDIVENMNLPKADDITLEYTGMNSSVGIKQADVIMVTYPLENEMISEQEAISNINFYSMKQVSYGPAMTFPIFSIVSANMAQTGCSSQSYLHKAVQPFLRAPFAQFSEQNNDNFQTNGGTNPAFPFLTAHGGYLQSILQGLTGLRFDYDITNNGTIKRCLKLDPIELPFLPNGVVFNGIKYMNQTVSLTVGTESLIVEHTGPFDDNEAVVLNITIGDRNTKKGSYELGRGQKLEIPLFKPNKAIENSVSECGLAQMINITEGVNGDSAYSINDGDNFTHWQPLSNSSTSKILVDLKQFKNITGCEINWGDRPPKSWSLSKFNLDKTWDSDQVLASVDFGNDIHEKYRFFNDEPVVSQDQAFVNIVNDSVDISAPFNLAEFQTVQVPNRFNTTSFDYPQGVWTRFILLEFDGVHDTVAVDMFSTGGAKVYEVSFT